jgi:hypothetical protein
MIVSERVFSGTGFSRKRPIVTLKIEGDSTGAFPAEAGPTEEMRHSCRIGLRQDCE